MLLVQLAYKSCHDLCTVVGTSTSCHRPYPPAVILTELGLLLLLLLLLLL
jgi:hypothetical protein